MMIGIKQVRPIDIEELRIEGRPADGFEGIGLTDWYLRVVYINSNKMRCEVWEVFWEKTKAIKRLKQIERRRLTVARMRNRIGEREFRRRED